MTIAYWCVFIMIFVPWIMAAYSKKSAGFSFKDNHNPRDFLSKVSGVSARANAAQQNSYEIYPAFAAAVIIAHLTGQAEQLTINSLAVGFVVLRVLFCIFYILDKAFLRSLSWALGFACIVALFISAA